MLLCEGSIIGRERQGAACREVWCCSTEGWDGIGVDDAALFLAFLLVSSSGRNWS